MTKYSGIVEGFYWTPKNEVLGQHSEFNYEKRIKLLEFMGDKGLNLYLYDPKLLRNAKENVFQKSINNNSLVGNITNLKETFQVAKKNKINFVWGLTPKFYNLSKTSDFNKEENKLFKNIEIILSLGANQIALLFDDCSQEKSDLERKKQADIAEKINNYFPKKLFGLCPAVYYGTKEHFEKHNKILDKNMSYKIPLIFTGHNIWRRGIKKEDVPTYKRRKMILWDNWMSADTSVSDGLFLKPPLYREKGMYKKIHSYMLNPCFPVERIIPMVSAVSQIHKHKGIYITKDNTRQYLRILNNMSKDWSKFLKVKEKPLWKLIYSKNDIKTSELKPKEIKHIIKKWPSLEAIFRTVM